MWKCQNGHHNNSPLYRYFNQGSKDGPTLHGLKTETLLHKHLTPVRESLTLCFILFNDFSGWSTSKIKNKTISTVNITHFLKITQNNFRVQRTRSCTNFVVHDVSAIENITKNHFSPHLKIESSEILKKSLRYFMFNFLTNVFFLSFPIFDESTDD